MEKLFIVSLILLTLSFLTICLNCVDESARIDVGRIQCINSGLNDTRIETFPLTSVDPGETDAGIVVECSTCIDNDPVLVVSVKDGESCICSSCEVLKT